MPLEHIALAIFLSCQGTEHIWWVEWDFVPPLRKIGDLSMDIHHSLELLFHRCHPPESIAFICFSDYKFSHFNGRQNCCCVKGNSSALYKNLIFRQAVKDGIKMVQCLQIQKQSCPSKIFYSYIFPKWPISISPMTAIKWYSILW